MSDRSDSAVQMADALALVFAAVDPSRRDQAVRAVGTYDPYEFGLLLANLVALVAKGVELPSGDWESLKSYARAKDATTTSQA